MNLAMAASAQTVLPPALTGLKNALPVEKKEEKPASRCASQETAGFDCAETALGEETARPLPKSIPNLPPPEVAAMMENTAPPRYAPPSEAELTRPPDDVSFRWRSAYRQSLAFLGIQHGFRFATEKGTRDELKGPFFKDYFKAVGNLAAWDDGDPFIVNYIGHPMMGAVSGYIQVQNDPKGIAQEVGLANKQYWKSRLKAFGWSLAYSTQFELGIVGEAGLGNIGIRPYEGHKHPMAYVDLVVTPVVGTAWLVGEDTLDKYVIRFLDQKINSRVVRVLLRGFLNPTRSMANMLRGKVPWHRDDRSF